MSTVASIAIKHGELQAPTNFNGSVIGPNAWNKVALSGHKHPAAVCR